MTEGGNSASSSAQYAAIASISPARYGRRIRPSRPRRDASQPDHNDVPEPDCPFALDAEQARANIEDQVISLVSEGVATPMPQLEAAAAICVSAMTPF